MVRADAWSAVRRSGSALGRWWRAGSSRSRLRRRLILISMPFALAVLAIATMLTIVLVTGNMVVGDFDRHDTEALRSDLQTLDRFNVIEPHKLPFAQGDLAVLESRLDDGEASFMTALGQRDECPTRINLELVRETQGDLAASGGDIDRAEQRYNSALKIVRGAQSNCFAGNDDPDPDRRHIRQDAEPRLLAKIDSLNKRRTPSTSSTPPATSGPASPAPASPSPASPANPSASLTPTTLPPPAPDKTGPVATTAPSPPPSGSGPDQRPVFGPRGGEPGAGAAGGGSSGGMPINDVDADRIPVIGPAVPQPGRTLGVPSDKPLDKLQSALEDAESAGGNRE